MSRYETVPYYEPIVPTVTAQQQHQQVYQFPPILPPLDNGIRCEHGCDCEENSLEIGLHHGSFGNRYDPYQQQQHQHHFASSSWSRSIPPPPPPPYFESDAMMSQMVNGLQQQSSTTTSVSPIAGSTSPASLLTTPACPPPSHGSDHHHTQIWRPIASEENKNRSKIDDARDNENNNSNGQQLMPSSLLLEENGVQDQPSSPAHHLPPFEVAPPPPVAATPRSIRPTAVPLPPSRSPSTARMIIPPRRVLTQQSFSVGSSSAAASVSGGKEEKTTPVWPGSATPAGAESPASTASRSLASSPRSTQHRPPPVVVPLALSSASSSHPSPPSSSSPSSPSRPAWMNSHSSGENGDGSHGEESNDLMLISLSGRPRNFNLIRANTIHSNNNSNNNNRNFTIGRNNNNDNNNLASRASLVLDEVVVDVNNNKGASTLRSSTSSSSSASSSTAFLSASLNNTNDPFAQLKKCCEEEGDCDDGDHCSSKKKHFDDDDAAEGERVSARLQFGHGETICSDMDSASQAGVGNNIHNTMVRKSMDEDGVSKHRRRAAVCDAVTAMLGEYRDVSSLERGQFRHLLNESLATCKLDFDAESLEILVSSVYVDKLSLSMDELREILSTTDIPTSHLKFAHPTGRRMSVLEPLVGAVQSQEQSMVKYFRTIWDDRGRSLFLIFYICVNCVLFATAYYEHVVDGDPTSHSVAAARGGGRVLHFNSALILIPMMRNFLTWARCFKVARWIPFDSAYDFHRIVGMVITFVGLEHALGHCVHVIVTKSSWHEFLNLIPVITGWLIMAIMLTLAFTSRNKVRQSQNYTLFHTTHLLLFGPYFILMLIHASTFWRYFILPGAGYVLERLMRHNKMTHATKVKESAHVPTNLVKLVLARPASFFFVSGQYLYLRVPLISRFETHPFTITSSPEDDFIELLIKPVGDWTTTLYALYNPISQGVFPRGLSDVEIDGPYGAPAQHIYDCETVVLVAGGIGVTPFASILRDIEARSFRRGGCCRLNCRCPCSCCRFRLKKVYFYWLCPEKDAFGWLVEGINSLLRHRMFEASIFYTSMKEGEISSLASHIALRRHFALTGVDFITGLSVPTRFGRPDWRKELTAIQSSHPDDSEIGVFFCGPHSFGKVLRKECSNINTSVPRLGPKMHFQEEIF